MTDLWLKLQNNLLVNFNDKMTPCLLIFKPRNFQAFHMGVKNSWNFSHLSVNQQTDSSKNACLSPFENWIYLFLLVNYACFKKTKSYIYTGYIPGILYVQQITLHVHRYMQITPKGVWTLIMISCYNIFYWVFENVSTGFLTFFPLTTVSPFVPVSFA